MAHKFNIGDKVRINAQGAAYWGDYGVGPDDNDNPTNDVGTVFEIINNFWLGLTTRVRWSNGVTNSYHDEDLNLVMRVVK
mgnify:CR=1 FL=1